MTKEPISLRLGRQKKSVKEPRVSFIERLIREGGSVVVVKEAVSLPIQSRAQRRMAWTTENKDVVGLWSWGQARAWTQLFWRTRLRPFLLDYEKKSWSDIERETTGKDHRYKTYDIGLICHEAQKRLLEIGIEELDVISRFRLSGKERLYGFVCQHVFFVVWWDQHHKIYPSNIQDRGKVRRK